MGFWEDEGLDVHLEVVLFAVGDAELSESFRFFADEVSFNKLLQIN